MAPPPPTASERARVELGSWDWEAPVRGSTGWEVSLGEVAAVAVPSLPPRAAEAAAGGFPCRHLRAAEWGPYFPPRLPPPLPRPPRRPPPRPHRPAPGRWWCQRRCAAFASMYSTVTCTDTSSPGLPGSPTSPSEYLSSAALSLALGMGLIVEVKYGARACLPGGGCSWPLSLPRSPDPLDPS